MLSCVILCGGLATRLRPITEHIPKSLIPISGEPFIAHQLRLLHSHQITRAVLCVGYLGEAIQTFVGDGSRFGMHVSYSFDGPSLLGTAGAIRRATPMLEDSFFVVYGDSYLPCDYRAVENTFASSNKRGLMTIYQNEGNFDSSNVEAANGLILRYDKRERTPAMRHIDYGLGVFRRSVFESLPAAEFHDLAGVYQQLLAAGDLSSHEVHDRFYEIGSLGGIDDLEKRIAADRV